MLDERRSRDKALGMGRAIDRRDFLNGVAVAIGGGLAAGAVAAFAQPGAAWPQDRAGYYPPALTGLRGSHPGSFEAAHSLRDGDFWSGHGQPEDRASATIWSSWAGGSAAFRRRISTGRRGPTRGS